MYQKEFLYKKEFTHWKFEFVINIALKFKYVKNASIFKKIQKDAWNILTQTIRGKIKAKIKNKVKKQYKKDCKIQEVKKSDGSIELRSCKFSRLDPYADFIAEETLKYFDL